VIRLSPLKKNINNKFFFFFFSVTLRVLLTTRTYHISISLAERSTA
jgi:hypothetical protein